MALQCDEGLGTPRAQGCMYLPDLTFHYRVYYWCVPAGMVVVRPEWLFDSVMAGEALGLGAYRHSPA